VEKENKEAASNSTAKLKLLQQNITKIISKQENDVQNQMTTDAEGSHTVLNNQMLQIDFMLWFTYRTQIFAEGL
jgi:HD superfamily phosphohydrolase YqeK